MQKQQETRFQVLMNHLNPTSLQKQVVLNPTNFRKSNKSDDDIVIVCPIRTAIGRAGRGSFKDSSPDKLLAPVLKYLLEKTKIDPKLIGIHSLIIYIF